MVFSEGQYGETTDGAIIIYLEDESPYSDKTPYPLIEIYTERDEFGNIIGDEKETVKLAEFIRESFNSGAFQESDEPDYPHP